MFDKGVEVAWEFFGTQQAKGFVHAKVAALFPEHEVEKFTDHFWGLIQFWRKTEADRMNKLNAGKGETGVTIASTSLKASEKSLAIKARAFWALR